MSRSLPYTNGLVWGAWQPQVDEELVWRAACMYYNTPPAGTLSYMIEAPFSPEMHYQNTTYMQHTPVSNIFHQQHHHQHQDTIPVHVKREFPQEYNNDQANSIMAPDSRGSNSLPKAEFCSNPYDIATEIRRAKAINPNDSANDNAKIQFDTPIDNFLRTINSLNVSPPGSQAVAGPRSSAPSSPATSLTRSPTSVITSPPSAPGTTVDDIFTSSGAKSSHKPKKHVCHLCRKAFSQKAHLKTHERTHTGEKPWKCPYEGCDHADAQMSNFNIHMDRHNGVKPYRCPKCGNRFTRKNDLKSHDDTVHLRIRPFICEMPSVEKGGYACHRSFTTRGNLKTHLNTWHSDDTQRLQDSCLELLEQKHLSQQTLWLVQWFLMTFQNSNKGVKGRGKGRKVAPDPLPVKA